MSNTRQSNKHPHSDFLYSQLERELRKKITTGQWTVGERLPSVRQLCKEYKLSKSTVLTSYGHLEAEGLIEARPRSGYFVASAMTTGSVLQPPTISQPEQAPTPVSAGQMLLDIMQKGAAFDILAGSKDTQTDNKTLRRCLSRSYRQQQTQSQYYYDVPEGSHELREQLAYRLGQGGGHHHPEDLLITAGCQHALMLALMATTRPGGVVAVESPGFYGVFQLLEALGLQALEIPSSPQTGISPSALELSLQHWDIQALVVSPCYSTPSGACMPDPHKQMLITLTESRDIPIIEDDIYGELYFGLHRPRTLYSYSTSGNVLLCSSFSKSLSRDLRIGWIAPGKYKERVKQLKVVTTLASSQHIQHGLCDFIQRGGLDRHLRQRRWQLKHQAQDLQKRLPELIPSAVRCSQPEGGMALWLELPKSSNMLQAYQTARMQGIILTPGRLFTAQEKYQHFLRLSFAHEINEERAAALTSIESYVAN